MQLVWQRKTAQNALNLILVSVRTQVTLFYKGSRSGQILFEIGSALTNIEKWRSNQSRDAISAGERAIVLYLRWRAKATKSVLCWLWIARDLGMIKDVRLLIANLVWEARSSWCDGKRLWLQEGDVVTSPNSRIDMRKAKGQLQEQESSVRCGKEGRLGQ